MPGLLCLDSDGTITHDPKSLGPESTIELKKALGYEIADFEQLLTELVNSHICIKGPDIPTGLSVLEFAQMEQYSNYCAELGKQLVKQITE
jgi:hypothetical protein